MKKVLVLGKSGMLGHVVYEYLNNSGKFEVYGSSRNNNKNKFFVNAETADSFKDVFRNYDFDYIINCIGMLIKESQNFPEKAILVNSWFPHYLASFFSNKITKIIHISTDCVFSGRTGFYKEDNLCDETNYYGRTKALGEIKNKKDLTIRTSIIGPELRNGDGLFNWFMSQPIESEINGFVNAFWNGVTTLELAKVIERILIDDKLTGLYHVVPKNAISKHNLLEIINKIFGRRIKLIPTRLPKTNNKILIDTRNELKYSFCNYEEQVEDMRRWIISHDFENYSKYK